MVKAFIADVLGWNKEDRGLFGHTRAYYGSVEQQGRLTLHLHLLLWIENSLSPQELRDRIMDSTSSFQMKIIQYLESCQQAELLNGSLEQVRATYNIDLKAEAKVQGLPEYIPPTHTLPNAPPPICRNPRCPGDCTKCTEFVRWWDHFSRETDDLILRSNIHSHFHSPKKRGVKRVQERKGCMNKNNVCRARFPRTIVPETVVSSDGHISVRHIEPMMNPINPVLTYFSRCNTDVTSLLSGTAVKAVISYVADYVSKISLKSYQLFASVFQVFQDNTDMLHGDEKESERSRRLVMKMVNSLSTKMEIGSPMASMYVLGHPDHYSSHTYVPFAWRSYALFVKAFWAADEVDLDDDKQTSEEKVMLTKHNGQFVPGSSVDDYRFRPVVHQNLNLFEWIQCSHKQVRTAKERREFQEDHDLFNSSKAGRSTNDDSENELDDEDDQDFEECGEDGFFSDEEIFSDSDWETDDEDEVITDKQRRKDKDSKPLRHSFLSAHPRYETHVVSCDLNKVFNVIPNFIGGALPRADKGDRNFYCMTMLVLFKPWRSPAELKDAVSTWSQVFQEHSFTKRQLELISNFNVRYECNDARDDHFAQMKKKLQEAEYGNHPHNPPMFGPRDVLDDDMNGILYDLDDDQDGEDEALNMYIGPRTAKLRKQEDDIIAVLSASGWLRKQCYGIPLTFNVSRIAPPFKNRSTWTTIVKNERLKFTANKLADMPPPEILEQRKRLLWDNVNTLPPSYFIGKSLTSLTSATDLKATIIKEFELNNEQARAFCILADHAS
ncbi:hypothetical protein B0H16DRAFT_1334249, partial [Mycena metata]